jgi:cell division protein FtsL
MLRKLSGVDKVLLALAVVLQLMVIGIGSYARWSVSADDIILHSYAAAGSEPQSGAGVALSVPRSNEAARLVIERQRVILSRIEHLTQLLWRAAQISLFTLIVYLYLLYRIGKQSGSLPSREVTAKSTTGS